MCQIAQLDLSTEKVLQDTTRARDTGLKQMKTNKIKYNDCFRDMRFSFQGICWKIFLAQIQLYTIVNKCSFFQIATVIYTAMLENCQGWCFQRQILSTLIKIFSGKFLLSCIIDWAATFWTLFLRGNSFFLSNLCSYHVYI